MFELATLGLAQAQEAEQIACMSRELIEGGLIWSWRESRVLRFIHDRDSQVLVARHDQRVIAFAIMRFNDESAHLNLLAVAPPWRRQGLGRRLLEWLMLSAATAGIFRIDLELRAGNSCARIFYETQAFHATGILPNYYANGEAAQQMSYSLKRR